MAAGQPEHDLGLDLVTIQAGSGGGPLAITSSRMGHLWDALGHAFEGWSWRRPPVVTRCSGIFMTVSGDSEEL
jgi:hypothetical protein